MHAPPKNVLYLSHAAEIGGAEFTVMRLTRLMDRTRVTPLVAVAKEGANARMIRGKAGVDTYVLPLPEVVRKARKDTLGAGMLLRPWQLGQWVTGALRYARTVADFAQSHDVDVIQTHSMKAHLYGGLAGRWAGIPVVWHMHDSIHPSYLPRPAVWAMRGLARLLPTRVIGISRDTLGHLRLPDDRGVVIHNGLLEEEIETYARHRDRHAPDDAAPAHIGIVGRLTAWKGQHVFLEAAAQVLQAGHDVHFDVIGGALFEQEHYEARLHRLVDELGIADHVTFAGHVDDVPAALAELDVLVHASTTPEPFGYVIIEGMSAGLPVIGADGGGVPDIIDHEETGLLSPVGDAATLARQIERLLDDPALARSLGQAGQERVRTHFTAERMARDTQQLYRTLPDARR